MTPGIKLRAHSARGRLWTGAGTRVVAIGSLLARRGHAARFCSAGSLEAVRVVDMASSNAWAEFATIFTRTHQAHLEHEQAKAELKSLVPEDAKEAIGHGVRAKRSKSDAISFDLATPESNYAEV